MTLDRALDIIDEGEDITADSLNSVRSDEELRRRCGELLALRAATRLNGNAPDVEERLKSLHLRIGRGGRRGATARLAAIVLAAAAAFFGALWLLNRPEPADEGVLYAAQEGGDEVTVSDSRGAEVPVRRTKEHTFTVSTEDYRRALADETNVEKLLVSVPNGRTARVDLPDGSVALLHPGSRLRFPTAFVGGKRFVMLEGEAYFKVRKDPRNPFIVQAEGIEMTVLGTEFNVKGSTVTLINGSVRVERQASRQSVVMTPGQQLSLVDDRFAVAPADTLPYVYWRDGYLYYDNMPIGDIMKAIGRTYNMTVRCTNTELLHQRMRFMAERDKGVDAAIDMMNRMGKVRVCRKDNLILVE